MKKTESLIRDIYYSNLFTIFLQELMFALGTLVDGIIVCHFLGTSAMAAIGIDSPFASILAVFSGTLGIGCQVGYSKAIGEGDHEKARSVFSTLLALSVIISAVFFAFFFIFADSVVISWVQGPRLPTLRFQRWQATI